MTEETAAPIKVLLVDDDPNQMEITKLKLEETDHSFKITLSLTPKNALKILQENSFDCIVSDYQMPEMNGIQLCTKIRKTNNIPFIIYTGRGSEEVASEAFAAGVDDYVRKEATLAHYIVLEKRVRQAVEKRRIENLYRKIIDDNRDGFAIIQGLNFVFANKAMANMLGINRPEDLFGKSILPWVTEIERDQIGNRTLNRQRGKKEPTLYEYHIKGSDGKLRTLEASVSLIDYNGQAASLVFNHDVTEQRRAEEIQKAILEQLENEKARFDVILNSGLDGITVNTGGVLVYVNDTFSKMMGIDKPELLGKEVFTLHTPEYQDQVRSITEKRQKGLDAPLRYEVELLRKDGSRLPVEYSVSLIEYEGKKSSLTTIRDITDSKKAREMFHSSEERYRSLFESMSEGVALHEIILDEKRTPVDYRFLEINHAFEQQLGVNRTDIIGRKVTEIFPGIEHDPARWIQRYGEVALTGKPAQFESYSEPLDRYYRVYAYSTSRLQFAVIFTDITAERRREDERSAENRLAHIYTDELEKKVENGRAKLQDSEERLRRLQQMNTISRIGAVVAHDLRGPLVTISQASEMARAKQELSDKMLELISDNAKRSLEMIEEFREGTREVMVAKSRTDLSSLIKRIMEEMPKPDNITLDLHLGEGLNNMSVDPGLIRRVLENLIRNGMEAMPSGGTLTVSARLEKGNAVIEVDDTGIGVEEGDQKHLFEPLFSRKKDGLGLGLYFVRMAVDAHGGVVDFNSRIGAGTTFKVLLPIE